MALLPPLGETSVLQDADAHDYSLKPHVSSLEVEDYFYTELMKQ